MCQMTFVESVSGGAAGYTLEFNHQMAEIAHVTVDCKYNLCHHVLRSKMNELLLNTQCFGTAGSSIPPTFQHKRLLSTFQTAYMADGKWAFTMISNKKCRERSSSEQLNEVSGRAKTTR